MAWVALDRAIRMAEELDLPATLETWRKEREAVHRQVLERGWSDSRGCFVQSYGSEAVDAANLLLGVVRFLPHEDPRVASTIERIAAELRDERTGLLYRYHTDDGLHGQEGCFLVNTFQLSQALALIGRVDEAREAFERVLPFMSPLGLLSEEVDPGSGRLIGNFPQAFSHIGLINAAHVLSRARRDVPADELQVLPG
jgi:GH15 family glucan-1,4-alpha-glucosidase